MSPSAENATPPRGPRRQTGRSAGLPAEVARSAARVRAALDECVRPHPETGAPGLGDGWYYNVDRYDVLALLRFAESHRES